MSTLSLYIIRQLFAPLLIITFALSGIIWLLRALRELDSIIVSGQSLNTWLEIILYTALPLLNLTIPPAFLLATLYAFYRLFLDNEITVLFSVGISRLRLGWPVMIVAGATAILLLGVGFYATPWAYRTMKVRLLQIDTDIASAMFRPGVFTNPTRGITAFIRARDDQGFIHGIFFQDSRDRNHPISYTAESGAVTNAEGRSELIMFNGHIQHYDRTVKNNTIKNSTGKNSDSGVTLIAFDRYSYDLSLLARARTTAAPRAQELYPDELLAFLNAASTTEKQKQKAIASFHERILKSIYVILYALLALAVFLPAQTNRKGYALRISLAVIAALIVRIGGIAMIDYVAGHSIQGALLTYALPIGMIGVTLFAISHGVGPIERIRHRIATARS